MGVEIKSMDSTPKSAQGRFSERIGPAKIYFHSYLTSGERKKIVAAANGTEMMGTVVEKEVGPLIGLVDIGVSDDRYYFCVSLPGVKGDPDVEINSDGLVMVKGFSNTGKNQIYRHGMKFEMQTQNLTPSGPFSVSFRLPGPIEPEPFTRHFGNDGILEGIVLKKKS